MNNKSQIRIRRTEHGEYALIFFFGENGREIKFYNDEGSAQRAAARCEEASNDPKKIAILRGMYNRGCGRVKLSEL